MDEPEPGWLDFLLADSATQRLSGLELESTFEALDTGLGSLFEPANLQSGIPEIQLDAPPVLPPTHSPLHHSSGAENTVQHAALSQNTSSGGGSCSGVEQAGGVLQMPVVCNLPGPGAAQQHWGTGGTVHATPGSTCSQDHSGTLQAAQVTVPDMADSSGQSDQHRCPADAAELADSDQKRQARLARNRENAQLSRQRKKAAVQGLEQRVTQLQVQNAQLTGLVGRLTVEVTALRFQLATVCQQAGRPVPHVPSALAPCIPALGALPTRPVATLPAGAAARLPAGQLPAAAPVPPGAVLRVPPPGAMRPVQQHTAQRVTPQQQQAGMASSRPVQQPAAQVQPVQSSTTAPAAADGGKGRKRARTAGSAFAALFMLFMFVGPMGSPGSQDAVPQALPLAGLADHGRLAALPAGSTGVPDTPEQSRAGRSLLQMTAPPDAGVAEVVASLDEQQQLLRALPAAASDQQPSSDGCSSDSVDSGARNVGGGNQLATLWNSTLGMLWPSRQPLSQPELEALALQRLQELAPVALLLDADDPSGQGLSPLAASQAFPQLAGQLFASSGLRAPEVCQPVFELDASSLPPSERNRRSIERLLLGTLGMKGRSLVPAEREGALRKRSADAAAAAAGGVPALPGRARAQLVEADSSQEVIVVEDGREWQEEAGEEEEGLVLRQLPSASSSGSKAHHEPLRLESTAAATLAETGVEEEIGSGAAPLLVSILVPANASNGAGHQGGNGGGLLSSLGKVFVVMLYPRQRYVVSACTL